jgi:bacterioferritin-associated ferredoxin
VIVCLCNALREREIERGLAQGVETVDELFSTFNCEARCRTCVPDIAAMIARELKRDRPTKVERHPLLHAEGG